MGKIIIYIAEDFPSLTETFVQNEILELMNNGFQVCILAAKRPKNIIHSFHKELIKNTIYAPSIFSFETLSNNVKAFIRKPIKYCYVLFKMLLNNYSSFYNISRGIYGFVLSFIFAEYLRNYSGNIHCHFAGRRLEIAYYLKNYIGNDCKITCTVHAADIYANRNPKFLITKLLFCNYIVCSSHYLKDYIKNKIDLQLENRLVVVHYGINSNYYSYHQHAYRLDDKIKLLSIGRLVPKKGFDILINACRLLVDQGINLELNIIGDGPERRNLEELCNKYRLNGKIIFWGAQSQDDVKKNIHTSDLFVLACRQDKDGDMDGIPNVLIESMAAGLPVISTYISGIPELIENGINGLLVKPEDSVELANAIKKVINDPDMISKFSFAGRQKVANEFEISINTKKLMAYF